MFYSKKISKYLSFRTKGLNIFGPYFSTNLEIKEDNNCKINNLYIEIGGEIENLIIPFKPFDLLNKIEFKFSEYCE